MDPVSLLVGGALTCVGWVLGRLRRPRQPAVASVVTEYHCGCEHPLALHDLNAGTCHANVKRARYDIIGNRNGFEWRDCACRRYDGLQPPPELDMSLFTTPSPPPPTET